MSGYAAFTALPTVAFQELGHSQGTGGMGGGHKIATAPPFSLLAAHRSPAEPKLPDPPCSRVPVCFHSPA